MPRLGDNILYECDPPWLLRVTSSHSEISSYCLGLARKEPLDVVVRILRGERMKDVDSLWDEFAAALQFPHYFGYNWPAFDECLADLKWLRPKHYADAYIFVVTDAALLLNEDHDSDLRTFLRIVRSVCEEWSQALKQGEWWDRTAKPFHFIFHATVKDIDLMEERFFKVGVALDDYLIVPLE